MNLTEPETPVTSVHSQKISRTDPQMEKQTLLSETNHRIANNLTILAGLMRQQSRVINAKARSYSADEVSEPLKSSAIGLTPWATSIGCSLSRRTPT